MYAYLRGGRERTNWRPWALGFTVSAFAYGLALGGGSLWMVADSQSELPLLILLIIFAATAGAVGAFGPYPPAFFAFFCAIAVPPIVWSFSKGDARHAAMGAIFLLWFVAVGEQARRVGRQFAELVNLRLENVEANRAKSRFLAAASHDLRQPVHALSVFVGAMRAHQMDASARTLLDHIDGSVRALSGLFAGLLDISRLDAGAVQVKRTPVAIQPIIDRVCRDHESETNRKGVKLRVQQTRAVVDSDPALCERILRNIVANAVTYTTHGTVLIGCRRGRRLRVQVWDTGPGIASHELQLIFQEFYQIGNRERDRTKGVGLGLAIVKRLTTLLGHPLKVESWPGKGSCFTIEIPLASEQTHSAVREQPTAAASAVAGSGLILVVDDERSIQIAMQSLLQSWGYSVIAAGSGKEIVERIGDRLEVPRLIICDYRLRDDETGNTVIEQLRHEYNEDIPGMLITGDTAPDRIKEAQASGYLLLHKPVSNSELRAGIAELLVRP
jgi:signal transduction histidine kinase/CheY-like chemotaxis protein